MIMVAMANLVDSTGADEAYARRELVEAVQREAPFLLAVARLLVPRASDAEDLVQETLERGVRMIGQLRDPAALRPWLVTIETREALRLRRQLRSFVTLSRPVVEIAQPGHDEDDRLAVRAALAQLSPRVRAVVVLHHMAGLSVGEVADALGTSENTVKTQLRIGLARLRGVLADE
jgi:RNA polymerase sigma factor (sigma-70 family)